MAAMVSEYVIKVQDQDQDQDQGHVRLMVSEYVIKVQVCVDQSVGEMPNSPKPNPNPNRMCVSRVCGRYLMRAVSFPLIH